MMRKKNKEIGMRTTEACSNFTITNDKKKLFRDIGFRLLIHTIFFP